jgi:DNA repair exonuclease SbcCD nuclease subunit
MVRFIHTSDLHLGKRFGQFPVELRGRLTEARHKSVEALRTLAQRQQANVILVAGDVFDTGTPLPSTVRQSMRVMADDPSIKWVLLPGNHDSIESDELWNQIIADRSENVLIALKNEPIEVAPSVFVLPAPCTNRRPGRDLTEWMGEASIHSDSIRIGLAHGAVQSFGEDGKSDVISPDRAQRSGLDYLALGDWHGQIQLNDHCWYSGTPEPDRFKHGVPGKALVVSIEGHGALPDVKSIETGIFSWSKVLLSVLPGEDSVNRLSAVLPQVARRRETLIQVTIDGRARLPERLLLDAAIKNVEPDFAWMEAHSENLATEYEGDDLDTIDRAGALRQAAEALLIDARSDGNPLSASATALSLLYSFAAEEA